MPVSVQYAASRPDTFVSPYTSTSNLGVALPSDGLTVPGQLFVRRRRIVVTRGRSTFCSMRRVAGGANSSVALVAFVSGAGK